MAEAREVMDKVNEALQKEDIDAAMECYSEDAELVVPEGRFQGRDQIKQFFGESVDSFSDTDIEVKTKLESGNKAVDEWSMKAKNTGPLTMPGFGESIPATNREVTMTGVDIATVENGKITSHHMYYDQKNFADQLGLEK